MDVEERGRGHPAPGRVLRGVCVKKMFDENGHPRLVINAPKQNSRQVAKAVKEMFTLSPGELSNNFERSATLVRLVIYGLTAASETNLTEVMSEIGKNFNALYMRFRGKLQALMVCYFDMFELFKTACYYFDEGKVDLGRDRLRNMREKSSDGKKILDDISQKVQQVKGDVEEVITRLTSRKGEFSEEDFEVHSVCLSECGSSVMKIAGFLLEQTTSLTEMERAFDVEEQCSTMQKTLSGKTFQELTDNDTPGGFMHEIHGMIMRCTVAKEMSKAYTEQLKAIKHVFTQMMSTTPTKIMAQQEVADMMADYNRKFPDSKFKPRVLERVQAINWTQPAPPLAPPPEERNIWLYSIVAVILIVIFNAYWHFWD